MNPNHFPISNLKHLVMEEVNAPIGKPAVFVREGGWNDVVEKVRAIYLE